MIPNLSRLGKEHNFRIISKEESSTQGTPYDYHSVMHYGQYAFSKNYRRPTIITKKKEFQNVIGQRLELSSNDIRKLNRLYSCSKCNQISKVSILRFLPIMSLGAWLTEVITGSVLWMQIVLAQPQLWNTTHIGPAILGNQVVLLMYRTYLNYCKLECR